MKTSIFALILLAALPFFGLISGILNSSKTAPAAVLLEPITDTLTATSDQTGEEVDWRSHLRFGTEAMNANNPKLALLHATFGAQMDPGNLDFAKIHDTTFQRYFPELLKNNEHITALEHIFVQYEILKNYLGTYNSLDGSDNLQPLLILENSTDTLSNELFADVSEKSDSYFHRAKDFAEKADRWWPRKNNRDDVLAGLIQLRWVFERLELCDTETTAEFYLNLDRLLQLVQDEERPLLLKRSGVDFRWRAQHDAITHESRY